MQTIPLILGATGGAAWVHKNGIPKWAKEFAEYQPSESSTARSSSSDGSYAIAPQPMRERIIVMPESGGRSNRNWLFWSSTAIVALASYYYYLQNSGTRQVIDRVDETAGETQDLVVECDENNERRFEVLDEKMEERNNELSATIRGEQRAHFDVLSDQLYCVTQLCLKTLDTVAKGVTGSMNDHEEFEHADDKLQVYAQ
jgi:hypothetical protein